jgi:hypothetical protein
MYKMTSRCTWLVPSRPLIGRGLLPEVDATFYRVLVSSPGASGLKAMQSMLCKMAATSRVLPAE